MDDNKIQVFEAITSFVNDLWSVFQSGKPTPLALYHRMIKHINSEKSENGMNDSISGFVEFFSKHEVNIVDDKLESIPRDTIIRYGKSEKVYLEIQKYIYRSNKDIEMRNAIRKHLLTIAAILQPDIKKFEALESNKGMLGIDDSTTEGKFLSNIMKQAQNSMGDVDTDNPTAAMSVLFTSVVPQLVSGLQNGVNSGQMDMYKLMSTMQNTLGAIMPAPPPESGGESSGVKVEEINPIE